MSGRVVLDVRDLNTYLYTRWGIARAVDGVSFSVREGETLGIVGESGSGKTMTALSLMRLVPRPVARIVSGEILLDGQDLLGLSEPAMRQVRGRKISMILQDPHTSLDPVYTIGDQILEAFRLRDPAKRDLMAAAVSALERVNVAEPKRRVKDYPHQLSGGMKQRVVGAICMSGEPRVLIADEPTTALDVTIQLQYLRLLKQIQRDTGLAIVFITHDFGVVAEMCDRVAVMYAGRIVEQGPVERLFDDPGHPYTKALIASVPKVDERVTSLYSIEGQAPSLYDLADGCRFAPRCPYATDQCVSVYPPSTDLGLEHTAHCWHAGRLELRPAADGLPRGTTG